MVSIEQVLDFELHVISVRGKMHPHKPDSKDKNWKGKLSFPSVYHVSYESCVLFTS